MRGLGTGYVDTFAYRSLVALDALPEPLQRIRYARARIQIPRRILPIFQFISWLFLASARLLIRLLPLIISYRVFVYVWDACAAFWFSKLNGNWAPAFPVYRTNFVLTLVTIPLWGAWMAVLTLLWIVALRLFKFVDACVRWRKRYEPVPMDLDDLEAEARERRRSTRNRPENDHEKFEKTTHGVGWLILWGAYFIAALFGLYMLRTYEQPIDHRFKQVVELANRVPKPEGYGTGEKIYLAAMFYNNGALLPYWITQVTKLIYYLGPENVFVSIVESNSGDNTADLLDEWDKTLENMGVARRILTRDTSIERPPSMETAPPRIKFLAAVRNLVMEPLVQHGGYARIVFSNDVFVEAESIVELLDTKGGNFDMACGLDLAYWGLYDQWVIRDRLGRMVSTLWPYFLEDTGFRAVMADEPAPVFTCWNGIIAVRADPFLPPALRTGQLSTSPLSRPLAPTHPAYPQPANLTPAATPPVRFRSSHEGECFSSESFLLPYDLRRQFDMQDIYVNPRVINSYSWEFYVWFKYITRHWAVKWFIEKVENGYGYHLAKMILGDPARVWQWDGGECHPVRS
ncbi:cryptococcal mannosyltransferase 1-domain-containing protein [Mycena alexandri]|uniref:Cryptococcal mannosyltransferase 1-domain-containing protein n=1 Tax=Mycena alexandri TaxID=1745969 RepID=A0AAD6STH5_9AGAR|nr:cryptococcal mannosyltransferase 1-domain-containing protein [Mycena alexandri]